MAYYRVVKLSEYQHYKTRNPPWIKLHRDLLTSRTWVMLDDACRALAIACMLLAAESDNKIPCDPAYVRRRAYLHDDPNFEPLIKLGFLELCDSCKRLQADASECLTRGRDRDREDINHIKPKIADGDLGAVCDSENPAQNKKQPKPKTDALLKHGLEKLHGAYSELDALRSRHHPVPKSPKPESAEWFKWRETIARLVTLDKYAEDDVVSVIRWLFDGGYKPDTFDWRDQIRSFARLRDQCKNGVTKFHNVYERWKDSGGGEPEHDEETRRLIEQARRFAERREAAERQAANATN